MSAVDPYHARRHATCHPTNKHFASYRVGLGVLLGVVYQFPLFCAGVLHVIDVVVGGVITRCCVDEDDRECALECICLVGFDR